MFPELQRHVPYGDVARLNVNAALEMAALYRLDLIAHDMGSTGHRSIIFDLCSGDVWVRHQPIRTRH
ncbi:Chemoreceptor glutamine deamidase CheD [compost metagenome]